MSTAIRARLDALRPTLESARASPDYAMISAAQSEALASLVITSRVDVLEIVPLVAQVSGLAWALDADKQRPLDALSNKLRDSGSSHKRTSLQNFEMLHSYFKSSQWDSLIGNHGGISLPRAIEVVIEHAIALGLRNATEATLGAITALVLVCVQGGEHARGLQARQLHDLFVFVKKQFKCFPKCSALESPVLVLPSRVSDFQIMYPTTFAAVFSEAAPPIPSRVCIPTLVAVQANVPLRLRSSPAPAALMSSVPAQGGDQMQMMQQMFMQMMAANMRTMGNRPRLEFARRPSMDNVSEAARDLALVGHGHADFEAPMWLGESGAVVEEPRLAEAPRVGGVQMELEEPARLAEAPRQPAELVEAPRVAAPISVHQATAVVLAAMHDKEEEKKVASKASAKASAKAALRKRPAAAEAIAPVAKKCKAAAPKAGDDDEVGQAWKRAHSAVWHPARAAYLAKCEKTGQAPSKTDQKKATDRAVAKAKAKFTREHRI